jgi:hypothetical protein
VALLEHVRPDDGILRRKPPNGLDNPMRSPEPGSGPSATPSKAATAWSFCLPSLPRYRPWVGVTGVLRRPRRRTPSGWDPSASVKGGRVDKRKQPGSSGARWRYEGQYEMCFCACFGLKSEVSCRSLQTGRDERGVALMGSRGQGCPTRLSRLLQPRVTLRRCIRQIANQQRAHTRQDFERLLRAIRSGLPGSRTAPWREAMEGR